MVYLVIRANEDGETVTLYDREEFRGFLDERAEYDGAAKFLSEWPDGNGVQYWDENEVLIIKGEIIVPRPVDVIKSYEFE